MPDESHLHALELRLSHERARLTGTVGDTLRLVWIAQIEREIADERARLGLPPESLPDLSDDELFNELTRP